MIVRRESRRARRTRRRDEAAAARRPASAPASEEEWNTVVVGSGFGGSVVAHRVAEEEKEVLVLERGQPYPPGSFPRSPRDFGRAFWDPDEGLHGMFEIWHFSGLDVICASGLGGGSLIYANVMLPKDPDTFAKEDLAAGGREHWPITAQDLEEHYAHVRAVQAPQRFPEAREPYASVGKARAMREAARALGLELEPTELAVLFSATPGADPRPGDAVDDGSHNLHGRPRSTCRLCGECDVGCNFGAKNTLDYTYLTRARESGAEIRTCCEVRTIEPLDGGKQGYRIGYRQHLYARDGHPDHLRDPTDEPWRTLVAKRLVLAAGAVGSPRLLLANRAALPGLSRALGTRVSANGDAIAWLRHASSPRSDGRPGPRYLDPSHGPVITTSVKVPGPRSNSGREHRIQDAGAPVLGDWAWEALELPKLPWRLRRTIARMVYRSILGRADTNVSAELAGAFSDDPARLLPLLGMGRDVPDGRYVLDGDRLDLNWSPKPSKAYYDALSASFQDVAEALGGSLLKHPKGILNRTRTVHPLGGCAMGEDERFGVVDSRGAVFGWPNLYVADGSVMPGPVGANPSFTIAAFADRVAEGILDA
jgi:cholesterol oxidase